MLPREYKEMTPALNSFQPSQLQSYQLIRFRKLSLHLLTKVGSQTAKFLMAFSALFFSSLEANLCSQEKLNWSKYCKGQKSGYSNRIQI